MKYLPGFVLAGAELYWLNNPTMYPTEGILMWGAFLVAGFVVADWLISKW
jgi:hypothetical protein